MMNLNNKIASMKRVRVKICGITCLEDALKAAELGTDALGFIFAQSPRRISPEVAKSIIDHLPPFVSFVGVFVNEEIKVVNEILEYCSLDYLQFHGQEEPAYCREFLRRGLKAFRIRDEDDLKALAGYSSPAYLLDTFIPYQLGGTGKTFDWRLAILAKTYGRIILSGGLTPHNVREAIRVVQPYAVDANSGLEISPGKKDHVKLSSFFEAVSSSVSKEDASSPISNG